MDFLVTPRKLDANPKTTRYYYEVVKGQFNWALLAAEGRTITEGAVSEVWYCTYMAHAHVTEAPSALHSKHPQQKWVAVARIGGSHPIRSAKLRLQGPTSTGKKLASFARAPRQLRACPVRVSVFPTTLEQQTGENKTQDEIHLLLSLLQALQTSVDIPLPASVLKLIGDRAFLVHVRGRAS